MKKDNIFTIEIQPEELLKPNKSLLYVGLSLILVLIVGILIYSSISTIQAGDRGVMLTFGKPSNIVLDEGLHFKIPLVQKVVKMEVKTQKFEAQGSAASRDLQSVKTDVAINFRVISEDVPTLYQTIGLDYKDRIIHPAVQETLKSVTAQYNAEELITKRAEVRTNIENQLRDRLTGRFIVIESISITEFEFSAAFDNAIEQKVTAEQLKLKAERDLERIEIEAKQIQARAIGEKEAEIARAEGQAQAISIINEKLEQSPQYLQYYALDKWDGILPKVTGESLPLIQIE